MDDPSTIISQSQSQSDVLKVLEALKQASQELQAHPPGDPESPESKSPAVKALLELETESETILSKDPNLSTLTHHLADLKSLIDSLQKERPKHGLIRSFLTRRVSTHSISRVAGSIESEIQAWIDRESIENLSSALKEGTSNEEELSSLLTRFETRVSEGFERELQDLVLKSRIFNTLLRVLCDPTTRFSTRIQERCASVVSALIKFNKDVFVGQVEMGPLIHSLVVMTSCMSIKVLSCLIRSIKSPLVDEIESNGEIPKIISYLGSKDFQLKVVSFDCVLEIGYVGRKEAIEAMIQEGLVGKLVELQRGEFGGDLIELGKFSSKEVGWERRESREKRERSFLDGHPFASCVAKFWVQLEVGEGLRQREKRAFKLDILERVREACVSDAEAATIVAEVLWGSSP